MEGHQGPYRTAMTIRQRSFIHNLMNKFKRYIEACHTCLKKKPKYKNNRPIYGRVPIDYALIQDLSIDIKHMPTAFGGYQYLLVIHLWDKGQMWPLFATTAASAMNTFASEALNGFSPFQLVFVHDPPDLTSLSFPKIDTILVTYREYYNLLLARAQMVGRLLLEWRTQQALEFENRNRQFTKEGIFETDQMVYLLAPHSSALQTSTIKYRKDFTGPLFIDNALDKTHYGLKNITGLLLDGMYHMNHIKRGSACTPQGIVNTIDDYEKALKNTLLNKIAIKLPDNKFLDITLKDGSKGLTYSPCTVMDYASIYGKAYYNYREDEIINKPLSCTELICNEYQTDKDGTIDLSRSK